MRALETIPALEAKRLADLEENARRWVAHKEPDGSAWKGWTLKPEADAALRQLQIVG
jgi:hypothetical protein